MKQVRGEITEMIEEAVKFAEESPWPSPEEVLEDVYA
jgi:pyruvate dehydrogenase E1 component alpha subunit